MRPLDVARRAGVSSPYAPITDIDLSSVAVASNKVFQTDRPAIDDCLAVWDEKVTSGVTGDKAIVLPVIERAVDRAYRTAATPLLEAFGRYCCYCETPISELAQVEHLLPKSQYPTYAVVPDNLLVACGPCNRRKSDTPTRAVATPWLTTATPTPADYKHAIRSEHYCWPDADPSAAWLPLRFERHDATGWQPVALADSVDNGVVRTSPLHVPPVRADLPTLGLADVEVRVLVGDDPASGGRGSEMIALCALNWVSSGTNDNRVHHRTGVWLDAVVHWHAELGGGQVVPATLSSMFLSIAEYAGCFSVWACVGEAILPGLRTLFATEAARCFPGTDLNRL